MSHEMLPLWMSGNFEHVQPLDYRSLSNSSLAVSTPSPLSFIPSEAPSDPSDYLSTTPNGTFVMSPIHLSPAASPRTTSQSRSDQARTQSQVEPHSLRCQASYAPTQDRRHCPTIYREPQDPYALHRRMSLLGYSLPMPNQAYPDTFEQPPPLPSQGIFKMLQSNGDPHTLDGHYTDLSDPPDLFAALQEEQIPPPEEDMNHSDPNMVPYEQELRFDGDFYTPKWVRGCGNKREGWCGICKPGRWLVLKNSAFWYDKSFTHGISAATGSPFEEPLDARRSDDNPDVWEGMCGSCNGWIPLVSSKKKGTTWFRHAYKCHTHQKVKNAPKRRREVGNSTTFVGHPPKAKTDTAAQQPVRLQSVTTPRSSLTPASAQRR